MQQLPIPQQQQLQAQPQQQAQQHHPMYQLPGNMYARSMSPVAPAMPQQSITSTHAEPSPLEEFEKLWNTVISNPNEFSYWEALVQYTSKIVSHQ